MTTLARRNARKAATARIGGPRDYSWGFSDAEIVAAYNARV